MPATADRPSNRDDVVELTARLDIWMSCPASPVPGLELLSAGRFRIVERTYGPYDPVSLLIGRVWIDKPLGEGHPIRLRTDFGESAVRFEGAGWVRLVFPPDEDPLDRLAAASPRPRHMTVAAETSPAALVTPAASGGTQPAKPWPRWVRVGRTVVVTALTLITTVAISLHAVAAPDGPTAKWALTVEDLSAAPDHRLLSHAAVNLSYLTLLLWAVGLFVFGVCVERSCGTLRTVGVVLAGAVAGAVGHALVHTPDGQQALAVELTNLYWRIAEARGLDAADKFAEAVGWFLQKCHRDGLVAGSAGVVAALIAYAALRRDLTGDGLTVRPLKFLLAAGYIAALVMWAWPKWVGEPFPYAVFAGGFLGGVGMIFPDKVLGWVWEKMKEKLKESWTPG